MKREISLALAVLMLMTGSLACAQEAQASLQSDEAQAEAPVTPAGEMGSVPPEKPDGGAPGDAPGGAPGGMQSAPEEYAAVYTVQQDTSMTGEVQSTGTDENAIHVQAGAADVSDAVITRASDDSTGADAASFYGVGAAVLATGGTVTVSNSTIETDAAGGAGVFAYADGVAYVSDTTITTRQNASGGTLQSGNGGLFYTTHTESEFVLSGVEIAAAEDSEYFLRATGNANERGWGASGSNGAMCTFTGIGQQMTGDVQWDSISTLDLYVTRGSTLTGAGILSAWEDYAVEF